LLSTNDWNDWDQVSAYYNLGAGARKENVSGIYMVQNIDHPIIN
jgi:hypothetical protein